MGKVGGAVGGSRCFARGCVRVGAFVCSFYAGGGGVCLFMSCLSKGSGFACIAAAFGFWRWWWLVW